MSTRILVVDTLYHPEALQADLRRTLPDSLQLLVPSSMAQRAWERALLAGG